MAHHKSAKKSISKSQELNARNRANKSRVKTFVKKLEEAVIKGDKEVASKALIEAQSELFRGVRKGVLHLKTASRKISRLSAKVKAIA